MRMLHAHAAEINFANVAGHTSRQSDSRRGKAVVGRRHSRRVRVGPVFLAPLRSANGFNTNGALGAGGNACRVLSLCQPSVAHIALANATALWVGLGHAI